MWTGVFRHWYGMSCRSSNIGSGTTTMKATESNTSGWQHRKPAGTRERGTAGTTKVVTFTLRVRVCRGSACRQHRVDHVDAPTLPEHGPSSAKPKRQRHDTHGGLENKRQNETFKAKPPPPIFDSGWRRSLDVAAHPLRSTSYFPPSQTNRHIPHMSLLSQPFSVPKSSKYRRRLD